MGSMSVIESGKANGCIDEEDERLQGKNNKKRVV